MPIEEIKKNLKTKKTVLGTELTIKQLKQGNLSKVFVSSNCPERVKKDLEHYSKVSKVPVEQLALPNSGTGNSLQKTLFSISGRASEELKETGKA